MTIFNFKITVRGLSWKEFYTLGVTAFGDRGNMEVCVGLVFMEFTFTIGDPL